MTPLSPIFTKLLPDPKQISTKLTPYERGKLKLDLYQNRAKGKCETCGGKVLWSRGGKWDKFTCAHLSHTKSRGAGGSDTKENCKIECFSCHSGWHGPRWGIK